MDIASLSGRATGAIAPLDPPVGEQVTDVLPVVEAHAMTSLVDLQLHSYRWPGPSSGQYFSAVGDLLDFALGGRPPSGRGKYIDHTGPHRRLGEIFHVPHGIRMEARVESGHARSLRCLVHMARVTELAEIDDESLCLDEGLNISNSEMRAAMMRMFREVTNPGFGSALLIDASAVVAVVELQRHLRAGHRNVPAGPGRLAPWQLRAITERLRHDAPPPNLAELAKLCRVSGRHLMRTFRASTGETVGAYVSRTQMGRARNMLSRSERSIKQISYELGFASPASFSRTFRTASGMSPNEYRREFRS